MPPVKEELQVFNLDNLNPALLPELATFKEIQLKVVEDNPFIAITDTASRDLAKKYRTARKTARTDLEKQDKLISSKFNDAKTKAKSYIAELIDISLPGEKKQQEEIDRDEEFLQLQRKEKARVEQQRIDNIKKEIEDYVAEWKNIFANMTFGTIEKVGADFLESYTTYDLTVLEEFESLFPKEIDDLTSILNNYTMHLTNTENARLEKVRLEEEAKELAIMKAEIEAEKKRAADVEVKAKAEKEQFEKEKAEFEENKRIEKQKSEYQLKVDGRISQLTDLELKFDFQSTFVGFDFFIDILDIKTYDDEKWNALILKIEDVKSTPLAETVKGIVEGHAIELIQNLDLSDAVEPTANVCYDLPKEPTWDSIAEDFNNSGGKSYSKWLKDNYNVPTKIQ
jgi:hypothetical protein